MDWMRQTPITAIPSDSWRETWRRGDVSFDLDVTFGKPLDVLSLKGADLEETRAYARFLAKSVAQLYAPGSPRERLTTCPVCASSTADAKEALRVFDVGYVRCDACGHGFVADRPSEAALKRLFAESAAHSGIYVDRAVAQKRIEQIVQPKLDWLTAVYERHMGRQPKSVVDVGAGGGHFLAAARQAGLAGEGFELSQDSRRFAQEAFGLTLRAEDYLASHPQLRDVVTYWGLLEYVSNPPAFMTAARARLQPGSGLLVVEVPRFDALGTVVQAANPQGVARHMDPTSHINCFSDLSLVVALVNAGFKPVAAWYFGLDAYELLVQSALMSGEDAIIDRCAKLIAPMQAALDRGRLCDDLIVAAVPI